MKTRAFFPIMAFFLLGPLPFPAFADLATATSPALSETEAIPASPVETVTPAKNEGRGWFRRIKEGFSLHRENYLLPLTWSNIADSAEDAELKFQFSFKQQLYRGLNFAYTQRSFWRILDEEDSRPFRDTTYNPELFYRFQRQAATRTEWGGELGIEHESNGNREPNSRSWNRLFVAPFIEHGPLRAELKLWHRLSEDAKKTPDDPTGDENPDIEKFYGYGELHLSYVNLHRQRASLMTRWNFATDKGALQLGYSFPTGTENLFLYCQFWTGYGESLIDYNRSVTRYGIGVLIRQ